MNPKSPFAKMALLFGAMLLSASPAFSAEAPRSTEAKKIVTLVDEAVALIESKGEAAFPELIRKGGRWYQDDTYVFVNHMSGKVLVNPPAPEIKGKNLIDAKDANGKPFMREFIETAKTKGAGWVDYAWPKPGEDKPAKKVSYVKSATMPNGEKVVVGAGIYVRG